MAPLDGVAKFLQKIWETVHVLRTVYHKNGYHGKGMFSLATVTVATDYLS